MSARITVIVYILICIEVGILLMVLPWTPYWQENFFLDFINVRLHAPWLANALRSGYVQGAATALGFVNVLAGLRDAFKFGESVQLLTEWENGMPVATATATMSATPFENSATTAADLSDHQPPRLPPEN